MHIYVPINQMMVILDQKEPQEKYDDADTLNYFHYPISGYVCSISALRTCQHLQLIKIEWIDSGHKVTSSPPIFVPMNQTLVVLDQEEPQEKYDDADTSNDFHHPFSGYTCCIYQNLQDRMD